MPRITPIDAYASASHYIDHMAPIWLALPPERRGRFIVQPGLEDRARFRGVVPDRGDLPGTNPILVASWGDYRSAMRRGRTRIAETQHGIGQSYGGDPRSPLRDHPAYPGGTGRRPGSLMLVPNDHAARRWRRAYPRGVSVHVVGSPRLETIPAREKGPVTVAFSFHWRSRVAPESLGSFDMYTLAIRRTARKVIVHAHPRLAARVSQWAAHHGLEFVHEFDDVARRASLYACDNSSSLYEFAATGRPVVVLNSPMYRREVEHGLRFWEAAGVGINCDRAFDLPDVIEEALKDPPEARAAREAALDIVFKYRTGAARRAAAALARWAG